MPKHLKIGRLLYQTRLQIIFQHRVDFFFWFTSGFISLLFTISVWKAFRPEDLATHIWQFYIIAGIINGLSGERFYHRMARDIREGELSRYLIQPFSYLSRYAFSLLASSSVSIMISLISLWLVSWNFGLDLNLNITAYQLIFGIPLVFIGWIISLLISFLIGCIGFVWIKPDSLYWIFDISLPFLVGASLPLWLLSDSMQNIVNLLPTRWIVSAPTELLVRSNINYSSVLVMGLVWLLILTIISHQIWSRVLKLYEAVGQ